MCHVCRAAHNVSTHQNHQKEGAQKSESESASSGSGDGCNGIGIAIAANQDSGTGIHQSIGICDIRRGAVRCVTTSRGFGTRRPRGSIARPAKTQILCTTSGGRRSNITCKQRQTRMSSDFITAPLKHIQRTNACNIRLPRITRTSCGVGYRLETSERRRRHDPTPVVDILVSGATPQQSVKDSWRAIGDRKRTATEQQALSAIRLSSLESLVATG